MRSATEKRRKLPSSKPAHSMWPLALELSALAADGRSERAVRRGCGCVVPVSTS